VHKRVRPASCLECDWYYYRFEDPLSRVTTINDIYTYAAQMRSCSCQLCRIVTLCALRYLETVLVPAVSEYNLTTIDVRCDEIGRMSHMRKPIMQTLVLQCPAKLTSCCVCVSILASRKSCGAVQRSAGNMLLCDSAASKCVRQPRLIVRIQHTCRVRCADSHVQPWRDADWRLSGLFLTAGNFMMTSVTLRQLRVSRTHSRAQNCMLALHGLVTLTITRWAPRRCGPW
jgi:hypothetical protein